MEAIERGTLRLSKGASASLAAIALLFVAMDHDMLLALAPVGPTVLVVAELLLRVHAALLLLTSYTSKDVAESAFRSTHPSSTVPWGATLTTSMSDFTLFHFSLTIISIVVESRTRGGAGRGINLKLIMSHKIIFVLKSIVSPTRASINPCLKALMPPYSRNAIPHIFVTVVIVVSLVLTLEILQENTGYYSDAQESPASSNPDQRRKIGFGDSDLSQCTTVLQPGGGLQVAINAANPGDIICLRAGEYTNSGAINMKSGSPTQARITIKSYPGESATIRAAIDHLEGDAPATLDGLVIDSHGASHASIRWWGDNLTARHVSVTNRNDTGSNASCIHMGA